MPTRLALAFMAQQASHDRLCTMAKLALVPAAGFMAIFLFGLRKTGIETGGLPIWWNHYRPLHGLCYIGFAVYALKGVRAAYLFLLLDWALGALLALFRARS